MVGKTSHDRGSAGSQSDEVRIVSEDKPAGFDLDQAESTIAPALGGIDPLLSADFSHPEPIQNDDSDNHFRMSPQDSKFGNDSNDETDKSKAKDNYEKNDGAADPAFLGTGDAEKNLLIKRT
ncbi:hypothetical protein E2562_006325 [Oryza meyeriana var. granulata]|uniref:Uncharacterized protein n=1 Tax=Oryza meyeriana var. granulata TaxID=110450 RepID=A0A6G1EG77_9ORYZ|nr:hypothetical protein E2562_006325 [Oryza meyeriana var. granulata]